MRSALLLAIAAAARASDASNWRSTFAGKYDAIVLGTGLKESLLAGLLANNGKRVLQLERSAQYGGAAATLDLNELFARMSDSGEAPSDKLGAPEAYHVDVAPKVLMAHGQELQLVVQSGAWKHMDFKRVQRSFIYRTRDDGKADVHRVLALVEDVVKTRMLTPMQKTAMVRLFTWLEKYKEEDPATWSVGLLSGVGLGKNKLDVRKMSAAAFLRYWEVTPEMLHVLVRGMALHAGPMKQLKKLPALELLRRLKKYKDAYKTFPHMTSPYVYPSAGFGSALPEAVAGVVEEAGGATLLERPIDAVLYDEQGKACGVVSEGVEVRADCVVAAPSYVPDKVEASYRVVRLYALLNHPPKLCKDARSCQLIVPAEAARRKSDVFLFAGSGALQLAPEGRWLVVASAKVEGDVDELTALQVAKRELAAVLPLLKPASKLFAELSDVCVQARDDGEASGLFVPSSCDESSHMGSTAAEIEDIFERITGHGFNGGGGGGDDDADEEDD